MISLVSASSSSIASDACSLCCSNAARSLGTVARVVLPQAQNVVQYTAAGVIPLDNIRLALLEEIDELPRRRSSYIATIPWSAHALLWGRMHDELQHDFRSADRGRAWRRNRWR